MEAAKQLLTFTYTVIFDFLPSVSLQRPHSKGLLISSLFLPFIYLFILNGDISISSLNWLNCCHIQGRALNVWFYAPHLKRLFTQWKKNGRKRWRWWWWWGNGGQLWVCNRDLDKCLNGWDGLMFLCWTWWATQQISCGGEWRWKDYSDIWILQEAGRLARTAVPFLPIIIQYLQFKLENGSHLASCIWYPWQQIWEESAVFMCLRMSVCVWE